MCNTLSNQLENEGILALVIGLILKINYIQNNITNLLISEFHPLKSRQFSNTDPSSADMILYKDN
jgi:hypothetical protein